MVTTCQNPYKYKTEPLGIVMNLIIDYLLFLKKCFKDLLGYEDSRGIFLIPLNYQNLRS